MTKYKMPKTAKDDVKTDLWSIAFLSSVGGGKKKGGALAVFDLFNRVTGRAHVMLITAGGKSSGLPVEFSFRDSGYMKFTTREPMSFPDFHNKRAKLTLKDRIGKSYRTVTVFKKNLVNKIAEVEVNNWNLTGWHGFEGNGITEVYYSDGKPVGNPAREMIPDPPGPEEFKDDFETKEFDYGLVLMFPGKILFDWNESDIHYQAEYALGESVSFINSVSKKENYFKIRVEGHTDSTEKVAGYNMKLSKRRAETILKWYKEKMHQGFFDRKFIFDPPVGLGATQLKIPDRRPDGTLIPEAQEMNRRVEVYLYRR